jgi:hypothetical protein
VLDKPVFSTFQMREKDGTQVPILGAAGVLGQQKNVESFDMGVQ